LFEKTRKLYSIFSNVWGILFKSHFAYLKAPFLRSENNKIVQNITDIHSKVWFQFIRNWRNWQCTSHVTYGKLKLIEVSGTVDLKHTVSGAWRQVMIMPITVKHRITSNHPTWYINKDELTIT